MDPHTARCLQLSTSICVPPYNPYRQNRFDSMNRSRFPVNSSSQQPRRALQRSNSMPATSFRVPHPSTSGAAYKHQYTPTIGPQSVFSPSTNSHYSTQDNSPATAFDAGSYFSANTSPETPFGNDGWDPNFSFDTKPAKQEGLGMNFFDQENNFTADPFEVNNEFNDLVHINGNDTMDFNNPGSPDRRSVSSTSSGDQVSDFPELDGSGMPNLNADVAMATVEEEDSVPDFTRQSRHGRSRSRAPASRASSAHRYRKAPYSFHHRRSSSVMSTASTLSMPMSLPATQCCSPVHEFQDDLGLNTFNNQLDFGSDPSMMADDFFNSNLQFDGSFQEPLIAPKPLYINNDTMFLNMDDPLFEHKAPILPSSHIPNEHVHAHGASCDDFADYAEEPDLFGPLSEEQSVPSEEDMNPEDKDMAPQEQDLRFEGDLYTPKFVRGQGNKREGYCGLCKPGRWLVLKNSAFWYDKSFTHGISASTGLPFDGPKQTRRMSGNPDVWEGLCGSCDEWIALISNKKKGTTWFRHAYKCHNHNKNKDAPKKRRDSVASKKSSSTPAKSKAIKQEENSSPLQSLVEDSQNEIQAPNGKALHPIGSFF